MSLKCLEHAMHAGRRGAEETLNIAFGGSLAMDGGVSVSESAVPASPAHIDYEYVRNGTANLFVFYGIHAGWRHVEVTEQRTSCQFAHQMQALVDVHCPEDMQKIIDELHKLSSESLQTKDAAEAADSAGTHHLFLSAYSGKESQH